MIKKVSYFLTNYKIDRKRIDEKSSFKDSLIATLGALLITTILSLIPILLLVNLAILDYLKVVIIIIVFPLIGLMALSFEYFYIQIIKNKYDSLKQFSFKHMIIAETLIYTIVIAIMVIVILSVV